MGDLVLRRGHESLASALHDEGGDSASDAHANVLPASAAAALATPTSSAVLPAPSAAAAAAVRLPPSAAVPGRHGGGNASDGFESSGEWQWWLWQRWTTRIHQVSSHSGCVPGKAQRTTAAVRPYKRNLRGGVAISLL